MQWQVMILVGVFLAIGMQRVSGETASPPPQPALPILQATFQNNLLSLEAHQVPWVKVLSEVRAKTGIVLHVSLSLEGDVSVSFKDLPVEQALRQLFGPDANFAILYPPRKDAAPAAAAVPREVWVLGRISGETSSPTSGPTKTPEGKLDVALSVGEEINDPVRMIEREFARNPLVAWNAAMGSRNQEVRLKAIAYLGQQANQEAMDVLLKVGALDLEAESHIRQRAVEALGALTQSNPQAREILTRLTEASGPREMQQLAADILGIQLAPLDDAEAADGAPEATGQQGTK